MKPTSKLSISDTALRVLILEDDPDHAFVLQHRLQRDRGDCDFLVVSEESAFRNALPEFSPQLILADDSLHRFCAIDALRVVREWQPSAVCILVTARLREEQSVEFIREGGDDCIDKVQLSRLSGAVSAALARRTPATGKAGRHHAKRMELFQSYLDSSPDGMLALDAQGYIMHMNEAAGRLLSGKAWAPVGNLIWEVFPSVKENFFETAFRSSLKDAQPLTIRLYLELTGNWLDCVFQSVSHGVTVLIREVSREEELRERLREMRERLQSEFDIAASLAAQQERDLLGQELHDNVNQLLASANLFLTMIRESPSRVVELLPYCTNSISKAIEENRRIAHGLVSRDQEESNILRQSEQLFDTMLRPAGIICELHSDNFADTLLPPSVHLGLYRILQEHCTNIVRHAAATRVLVEFSSEDDMIKVVIADNGQGTSVSREHNGIGLHNMSRRARELGGRIDITTSPGNGFVLEVRLGL